jgi:hypothetical protein
MNKRMDGPQIGSERYEEEKIIYFVSISTQEVQTVMLL